MEKIYTKFIQSNLKWNSHVSSVVNKISRTIGILYKVKNILLSTHHLTVLYHSLVEPYLNYCCIIWATPSKNTSLETLLKLQKRCVRIISYSPPKAHSRPLFNKLHILSVYDLCLINILVFVYRSVHLLFPYHFTKYFTRTWDIHLHETRGKKHNLDQINSQISCRIKSVVCSGPKHWNTLPDCIRSAPTLKAFKSLVKQHILSQYMK